MNLSLRFAPALFVTFFLLVAPMAAQAQLDTGDDNATSCAKIEKLRLKKNIPGARDAALMCIEWLEKQLDGEIGQFFYEEVAGWKRDKFEQSQAMGMRSASGWYVKNGTRVHVTLMGGGNGRGLGGALSGLARMGMMGGGRSVKIAGLPANVMPNGQVMVPFKDGTMLTFESAKYKTPDEALEGMGDLIDKFPVAKIRDALTSK